MALECAAAAAAASHFITIDRPRVLLLWSAQPAGHPGITGRNFELTDL